MLDLLQLARQLPDLTAYESAERPRRRARLALAVEALRASADGWRDLSAPATPWPMAIPREDPSRADRAGPRPPPRPRGAGGWAFWSPPRASGGGPRPTPVTVVATDGSQIFPDRHVEPYCYLINVSRIAFQYGTEECPVLESATHFSFRKRDIDELFDEDIGAASAEVVAAKRDELELQELLAIAGAARRPGRPLLAIADGTLIRWMLEGVRRRSLADVLIARYTRLLAAFRESHIPLCSYISMPNNVGVVKLLEHITGASGANASFAGLRDRWVFAELLAPGQRSAVFESASQIRKDYDDRDVIRYFYVSLPVGEARCETGRVEMPRWVAEDAGLRDLVHATVVSECEKGDGFPMILSEAHERAVIRGGDREAFYSMVERELERAGLSFTVSRKHASKRGPVI